MAENQPNKGDVLLEMLVAMVILSVVLTSVYSAFHVGVMASRRAAREDSSLQNIAGRLHWMAAEIRNAVYQNNVLLIGKQNDLYFFVPMTLKEPSDILPLYRVHYWVDAKEGDAGTLYRSVIPWIALQKPGMSPDDIARLEKPEEWLSPLYDFTFEYAVSKKRQIFQTVPSDTQEPAGGAGVDGNPDLSWRPNFNALRETPYGIRIRWAATPDAAEKNKLSFLFWPALGWYQTRTELRNVAPTSGALNLGQDNSGGR